MELSLLSNSLDNGWTTEVGTISTQMKKITDTLLESASVLLWVPQVVVAILSLLDMLGTST